MNIFAMKLKAESLLISAMFFGVYFLFSKVAEAPIEDALITYLALVAMVHVYSFVFEIPKAIRAKDELAKQYNEINKCDGYVRNKNLADEIVDNELKDMKKIVQFVKNGFSNQHMLMLLTLTSGCVIYTHFSNL